ncbi:MAG: hypothetical protein FVQ81_02085 [Candidatus Glassbacteria bacterium]|nr:hypothetical protein [Candidatus Glassbacteria bacterium]
MAAPLGKTVHELTALALLDISDSDQFLIGDASEPLKAKRISYNILRTSLGQTGGSGNPENPAIDVPSWVLEGKRGFWRVNVLSAVTDAYAYQIWYYNEDTDTWVLYPVTITETRGVVGLSAGPLIKDIQVQRDVDGIAPRTYRRFKIQTVTATETSSLSAEQSAYSITALPADYVPTTPTLEDSGSYPFTESRPKYMAYGHNVILKIHAASGEEDYIDRYELQRRDYSGGQGDEAGWATLPMHTLTIDSQLPSPLAVIYKDDSSAAAPGDVFEYRVRAIDSNGAPSVWTSPGSLLQYTVEEDTTAPDAPVLTIIRVALGFKIIIAPPTQNGGDPCSDVRHWFLFGRKGADAYANILGADKFLKSPEFTYHVPDANLGLGYQFKAMAVDWSGNESTWSTPAGATTPNKLSDAVMDTAWTSRFTDVEDGVSSNTTSISQNATAITLRATKVYVDGSAILGEIQVNAGNINLRVQKNDVINQINISIESIDITGRTIVSAGSGSRVEFFPDSDTGLMAYDNSSNEIFKILVGGAGVGDVIIGDEAGQYAKWDKSAGKFYINGELDAAGGIRVGATLLVGGDKSLRGSTLNLTGNIDTIANIYAQGHVDTDTALKINGANVLTGQVADQGSASGAAGDPPTKAEFDALVGIVNAGRDAMRAKSLMA